ncbi:MAG: hypothetical protein O3C43_03350 [Verrucomicrobia bacterium]|nr:hypothetical protein [Verrucomicrobiota bacterium]MDA1065520.1 hypothetical protein [Verrucomicrobiota bacterium]
MTIQELENTLPNGFHNAVLNSYEVDNLNRIARFKLEICVSDPESKEKEEKDSFCAGVLELGGLEYFVVDAPDKNTTDSYPGVIDLCDPLPDYPEEKKKAKFRARFYWSYANSFIHFAADEATFTYED